MGKYDALMAFDDEKYGDLMAYDEPKAPEQSGPDLASKLIGRGKNIVDALNPTKPVYGVTSERFDPHIGLRAVRLAGQAGGAIGDVVGAGIGLGAKLIPQPIKDKASQAMSAIGNIEYNAPSIDESGETYPMRIGDLAGSAMQDFAKLKKQVPQPIQEFAGDAMNAADLIGAAGAAKGLLKIGGEAIEQKGKGLLRSALKIKDVTARKAGRNVEEGVENIINNIAKHQVQSTGGGIKGIAQNARNKIDDLMEQSDELIREFGKRNPGATVDVEDTMLKFMDDLDNGRVQGLAVESDAAQNLADKIYRGLEKVGLAGQQPVEKIPEIKKFLKQEFDIFKKGPFHVGDDAFKSQVADNIYFRMKEQLDNFIPEMKNVGTQMRELIEVENAMLEAAKRTGNNNAISLTDWVAMAGGPQAAAALGAGPLGAGAIPASLVMGKKLIGQGRGPSGLMSVGQSAQRLSREMPIPAKAFPLMAIPSRYKREEDE